MQWIKSSTSAGMAVLFSCDYAIYTVAKNDVHAQAYMYVVGWYLYY